MKKILGITICALLLMATLFGCGKTDENGGGASQPNETETVKSGTLEELGYEAEDRTMEKYVLLEDVYFPDGLLETGFGMYIRDSVRRRWIRTNTEEGKALFDPTKSMMIYAHGMGGNGTGYNSDEFAEAGNNVLCFMWGAFSDEYNVNWARITNKIWYGRESLRWFDRNGNPVENDLPNYTVAEMYGAFYYDLMSAFPEYSGSDITFYGHSYGGMLTTAVTSYVLTAYRNGLLPAYMLPTKVHLLDPYFSRATVSAYGKNIPWLGDYSPDQGNDIEAIRMMGEDAKKLGVAIALFRTSKSVCWPTTLHQFDTDGTTDVTGAYWEFCNNIVYTHMDDACLPLFVNDDVHGYGSDWAFDFCDGWTLVDANATLTSEEAYSYSMAYDKLYARAGVKYQVNFSGTINNVKDDTSFSFRCEYSPEVNDSTEDTTLESETHYTKGSAKIAGFVYYDRNGNGKLDEGLRDHFCGATVTITDADGVVAYQGVTDVNGYYEVETDTAGEYTVTVALPEGDYTLVSTRATATVVDPEYQLVLCNFAVSK